MTKLPRGWTIFIALCGDGTYFSGLCRDLKRKLREINRGEGYYFSTHPERLPVKVIYEENELPFREAFAKYQYLREMNRKLKDKLMKTRCWPLGGPWRRYLVQKGRS